MSTLTNAASDGAMSTSSSGAAEGWTLSSHCTRQPPVACAEVFVLRGDRTAPQLTLAERERRAGGNGGGGGGSSQSAVLNKLTGLILSSPFRGSALIVSALNTMRPALISILADVQVDLTINTDCGARHICTQTPSDRRTGYGCPPSLELNNLQFHTHR